MSQALQLPHLANTSPDQHVAPGGSFVFPTQNPVQSLGGGGTHAVFNPHMGPYQSVGGQPYRPIEVHDQRVDPMEGLISKLTQVMSEQVGLKPKEQGFMYRRPYPDWVEQAPMPPKYKLTEFSKFSGQDNITTVEHISKYIAQLG